MSAEHRSCVGGPGNLADLIRDMRQTAQGRFEQFYNSSGFRIGRVDPHDRELVRMSDELNRLRVELQGLGIDLRRWRNGPADVPTLPLIERLERIIGAGF
jgi:hypothetical protein